MKLKSSSVVQILGLSLPKVYRRNTNGINVVQAGYGGEYSYYLIQGVAIKENRLCKKGFLISLRGFLIRRWFNQVYKCNYR